MEQTDILCINDLEKAASAVLGKTTLGMSIDGAILKGVD